MTGYIKMIDIWMIFTMSYPFVVITLHCLEKIAVDRGTRRINVKTTGTGETFKEKKTKLKLINPAPLPVTIEKNTQRFCRLYLDFHHRLTLEEHLEIPPVPLIQIDSKHQCLPIF